MEQGKIKIEVSGENQKIEVITDGVNTLDFRDKSMIHPVNLFLMGETIQVTNVYATAQHFAVGITDNVVDMLSVYISSPAVSYRHIHNISCKETIKDARKILATYVTHLGRNVSSDEYSRTLQYLRVLTVLGDKKIIDKLQAAINSDDQAEAFSVAMKPLMDTKVMVAKYISLLELYYGYVKVEILTPEDILTCPVTSVESRMPAEDLDKWALDRKIIEESQSVMFGQ